jgi:hypothetical protein
LPAKDHLQRFLLLRAGGAIHEKGSLETCTLPERDMPGR